MLEERVASGRKRKAQQESSFASEALDGLAVSVSTPESLSEVKRCQRQTNT